MATRLIAARHDAGIKRERTRNKPLALNPHRIIATARLTLHPRHCDRTRSGREAIQKKTRFEAEGQEHGWPRGLSPLAMTRG